MQATKHVGSGIDSGSNYEFLSAQDLHMIFYELNNALQEL